MEDSNRFQGFESGICPFLIPTGTIFRILVQVPATSLLIVTNSSFSPWLTIREVRPSRSYLRSVAHAHSFHAEPKLSWIQGDERKECRPPASRRIKMVWIRYIIFFGYFGSDLSGYSGSESNNSGSDRIRINNTVVRHLGTYSYVLQHWIFKNRLQGLSENLPHWLKFKFWNLTRRYMQETKPDDIWTDTCPPVNLYIFFQPTNLCWKMRNVMAHFITRQSSFTASRSKLQLIKAPKR